MQKVLLWPDRSDFCQQKWSDYAINDSNSISRLNSMLISIFQPITNRISLTKAGLLTSSSLVSILLASQSLAAPESPNPSLCPTDADLKTVTLPNQQLHSYLHFAEGAWDISIVREYRGKCKLSIGERLQKVDGSWIETSASPINLDGSTFSGNKIRHVYTWEKEGRTYVVIWQPTDERFVRLQVIKSNGVLAENVLLTQVDR